MKKNKTLSIMVLLVLLMVLIVAPAQAGEPKLEHTDSELSPHTWNWETSKGGGGAGNPYWTSQNTFAELVMRNDYFSDEPLITVELIDIDSGLTSPQGNYRWLDIANQLYGTDYRNTYDYGLASVEVAYKIVGNSFQGALTATNLKPNFAYQLKLVGTPGTPSNEAIGLAGRWWQEMWNGTNWANGNNLNNKGDGSAPNPNDAVYFARRDISDLTSPTGLLYRYTGYLVFDYFITDESGNATFDFATDSSYHVLWATNDSDGNDGAGHRNHSTNDGPLKDSTFDADLSSAYDDTEGDDFPSRTVAIFGEWERLPVGGVFPSIGEDLIAQLILTEESFHGSGGATYSGGWAAAMGAAISARPPIADAGENQTVMDSDNNGVEPVTLDGSGSSDPDGTIMEYEWKEGETILGNTEVLLSAFAIGTHTVTLTVTDESGATASDETIANVEGHILSRFSDHSSNDRVYSQNDTLYIKVWTSKIDYNNLKKAEAEFRCVKEKFPLGSHNDGTYTGSKELSDIPSGDCEVKIKVEDNNRKKYEVRERISITELPPIPVHDVAVTVIDMPSSVVIGEQVDIHVTVSNQGSYPEAFTLTLADTTGGTLSASLEVTLAEGESKVETFIWDTSGASGEYIFEAVAGGVLEDADPTDNSKTKTVAVLEELASVQATLTNHVVKAKWDRKKDVGKAEVNIAFTIDNGSSSQILIREITDESGTWSLEKPQVEVKINGQRNKWSLSLDANNDPIIDFGARGITLSDGDKVEIKIKLLNGQPGTHSLTCQILADGNELAEDTVTFGL